MPHAFKKPSPISVAIQLGKGVDFAITQANQLVIHDNNTGNRIELGLATERRIEQIQDYLGRLYVHAVEEEVV